MCSYVGFHALSDLVACFCWCNEKRQETRETWVFMFGSRCVIDTAFFAKYKLITCDTSITSYLGHAKALVATSMHREGLVCACFPAPTLTAAGRPKQPVDRSRRRHCANFLRSFSCATRMARPLYLHSFCSNAASRTQLEHKIVRMYC